MKWRVGWFSVSRLCRDYLLVVLEADCPRHLVEVEALVAADEPPVVVVLPWGEHEELPLSAGVEPAASGLGQGCEAVFLEGNYGVTLLKGCLHDGFLARADAGRHENGSILCL